MNKAISLIGCLLAMAFGCRAGVQLVTYKGASYYVYRVRMSQSNIEFRWKQANAQPLASFQTLEKQLANEGKQLIFATNGGIFSPTLAPLGLYIENGTRLHFLNNGAGKGNYYMKPNAVFYITSDKSAGIATSENYTVATAGKQIQYALQSGPQLLIDGKMHPDFQQSSPNVHVRSGVGVISADEVVFAMSALPVNFYDFADFFQGYYNCANALYLDGTISSMFEAKDGQKLTYHETKQPFSVMIADVKPAPAPLPEKPAIETQDGVGSIYTEKGQFLYKQKRTTASFSLNDHAVRPIKSTAEQRLFALKDAFGAPPLGVFAVAGDLLMENGVQTGRLSMGASGSVLCIASDGQLKLMSVMQYDTNAPKNGWAIHTGAFLIRNGQITADAQIPSVANYVAALGIMANGNIMLLATDQRDGQEGELTTSLKLAEALRLGGCLDAALIASGEDVVSCLPGPKYNWNAKLTKNICCVIGIVKK